MRHSGFYFFRAEAGVNERVLSTRRAFLWDRGGMSAQMTTQSRDLSMKGERNAAIRTIARFAAIAT